MPTNLLGLEALSAILGRPVKSHKDSPAGAHQSLLRPHDIIHSKWSKASLEDFLSKKNDSRLPVWFEWETLPEAEVIRQELHVNEEEFFDPPYDYDFTDINDQGSTYERGGERYSRPCGWMRIALKVVGKYEDGDGWLGIGANAWPVSYHGTSFEGAEGIIQSHYTAGNGAAYGRGIYSTPKVDVALGYSERFKSKITNTTYDVIIQNRINPKNRKEVTADYWLVPLPITKPPKTPKEEAKFTENSIRPYGLLLKEVEKHN